MPRPVVEQKTVVAPVPITQESQQQLGVYAPIQGVQAPQAGGVFQGLAKALGVIGPSVGGLAVDKAKQQAKADAAEGQADAELEQVDPERAAHSRAYADAAHNTSIIRQYQDAEAATTEWAATNLDQSQPFTEQTAALDAEMKRRLGALAQDPRAKALIAPRYQKFIEGAANTIVSRQVEARANEALDTAKGDIAADLAAGGDGRYTEQVQRLTPLLGDRTKAVQAVVGMYIDHAQDVAAKGGDWQGVFNALPSDIALPDGTKIPGPGRSPALHDALERGRAQAQQAFNAYAAPIQAQQRLHVLTQLDETARHGGLITEQSLRPYVSPGADGTPPLLSPEQAAGFIDRARDKREALAAERAAHQALILSPNWERLIGTVDPSDPKGKRTFTAEGFQKEFDRDLGMATNGNNYSDPENVSKAIAASKQYRLFSSSLKEQLSTAASRSTPAAAVQMLTAYDAVKAAGQAGQYLTDSQQAFYENLRVRQVAGGKGASTEALEQAAATHDPEQIARTVTANLPDAMTAFAAARADAKHWWQGGTKFADFGNSAMVKAQGERLLKQTLADNGGNVPAAVKAVTETINSRYYPVTIGGAPVLIPNDGLRTQEQAQRNMDILSSEVITAPLKAAGYTKAETERATFNVFQIPGQAPELEIVDSDTGLPFAGVPVFKLEDALLMADERRRQLLDAALRVTPAERAARDAADAKRRAGLMNQGRGA